MPRPGFVFRVTVRVASSIVKAFFNDVVSPRNVGMHRFADDVARLREPKFQRGRGADRSLWIVRGERDAIGVRQGRDATRFAEAAAVRDVELTDLAAAPSEQIAKRRQMRDSFARCDGRADRRVDGGQSIDAFGPAGFFEKVQAIGFERFRKLHAHRRRRSSMAIDHDVDVVANGFAHRGDARIGGLDRLEPFNGHGRRHGHRLERGEAIGHGLLSQLGESSALSTGVS